MNITVLASREDFDQALVAARQANREPELTGLAAPLHGVMLGRIEEAWDRIEVALLQGFQFGKVKAQPVFDQVIADVEQLLTDAGPQARRIQEALLQRMQVFMRNVIKGALARVPTTIEVGDLHFKLSGLRCTQKLIATGSLKANLVEVFSLTANGEIEVATDYSLESSPLS